LDLAARVRAVRAELGPDASPEQITQRMKEIAEDRGRRHSRLACGARWRLWRDQQEFRAAVATVGKPPDAGQGRASRIRDRGCFFGRADR